MSAYTDRLGRDWNEVRQGNLDEGLFITTTTRYVDNVLHDNNGGNANPQIIGGTQAGVNTCGTTACP
jgi:hypothetical protein